MMITFAPNHLITDAEESGFFQCPNCGLIWIGKNDREQCPSMHGAAVHVVVLCNTCDVVLPVSRIAAHLSGENHLNSFS
jgi:hypothetical protein